MGPEPGGGGSFPSKKSMAGFPQKALTGLFFQSTSSDLHGKAAPEQGRARNCHRLRERRALLPPEKGGPQLHAADTLRLTTYATTVGVQKPLDGYSMDKALADSFRPKDRNPPPDSSDRSSLYAVTYGLARSGRRLPPAAHGHGALPEGEFAEPGNFLGTAGFASERTASQTCFATPTLHVPAQKWIPTDTLGSVRSTADFMETAYRMTHCRQSPKGKGLRSGGLGDSTVMAASTRSLPADLEESQRILRASFMRTSHQSCFLDPATLPA